MLNKHSRNANPLAPQDLPWYRQFWPWFIIALPASAVIAGFITLWLAISRPDHLVVDESKYRSIKSELKAQAPVQQDQQERAGKSEPSSD